MIISHAQRVGDRIQTTNKYKEEQVLVSYFLGQMIGGEWEIVS